MQKFSFMVFVLAILLAVTATACSDNTAIIDELVPENIVNVELGGFLMEELCSHGHLIERRSEN